MEEELCECNRRITRETIIKFKNVCPDCGKNLTGSENAKVENPYDDVASDTYTMVSPRKSRVKDMTIETGNDTKYENEMIGRDMLGDVNMRETRDNDGENNDTELNRLRDMFNEKRNTTADKIFEGTLFGHT